MARSRRTVVDQDGRVYKEKKRGGCLKWIGIGFILFIGLGALGSMLDDENSSSSINENMTALTENLDEGNVIAETETIVVEEESSKEDEVPRELRNALKSAEAYVKILPFSKEGLYEQLIFEEYPVDAAQYAVDNLVTDWNANALKAAIQYQDIMPMSLSGLYDQLIFEGYTTSQSQYAIDNLD